MGLKAACDQEQKEEKENGESHHYVYVTGRGCLSQTEICQSCQENKTARDGVPDGWMQKVLWI